LRPPPRGRNVSRIQETTSVFRSTRTIQERESVRFLKQLVKATSLLHATSNSRRMRRSNFWTAAAGLQKLVFKGMK